MKPVLRLEVLKIVVVSTQVENRAMFNQDGFEPRRIGRESHESLKEVDVKDRCCVS